MTTTRSISGEAHNKKIGMRLDELEALIKDARQAGATGNELVFVTTVGFLNPRVKTATINTAQGAS